MVTPKVAILLAAYNGEKWIQDQIESILEQIHVIIDLFISVDFSSDRTYWRILEIADKRRNIKVLSYGGRYRSAKANFFRLIRDVDFSQYDYIGFSDQDDIWYSDKVIRSISTILRCNCDAYSSDIVAFWENGKSKIIRKSQPQTRWDYLFEGAGPGCTYLLKQTFASSLKKFLLTNQENIPLIQHHDWFIYSYARMHGFRWIIDNSITVRYRQHLSNAEGANVGFASFLLRIKKVLSGDWVKQLIVVLNLVPLAKIPFRKISDHPRWTYFNMALRCNSCRRKRLDKAIFFFSCIALIMLPKRSFNECSSISVK